MLGWDFESPNTPGAIRLGKAPIKKGKNACQSEVKADILSTVSDYITKGRLRK